MKGGRSRKSGSRGGVAPTHGEVWRGEGLGMWFERAYEGKGRSSITNGKRKEAEGFMCWPGVAGMQIAWKRGRGKTATDPKMASRLAD